MKFNSRSLINLKTLSLTLIFIFLIAAQCCTVTPTPTVTEPAVWKSRLKATDAALIADKTTLLNLKVDFQYNFDEYRFKVGADSSTPCGTDSGYTPWTPKATRLQADISAIPDGKVKLCLLGRGKNNCNNVITQLPIQANFYRWNKDTTGPGAFSITGPTTPQTATTFAATWGAATGAAGYTASIHSATGCQNATMLSQYSSTGTTTNVTVSAPGNYFLCVKAADALGNSTNASNNGLPVTVQGAETIIEDRITDRSCWADGTADPVNFHYAQRATVYPELGSTFIGDGKKLSKVGVLFGTFDRATQNDCLFTDWDDMEVNLGYFEKSSDYVAQPRNYINRPGVVTFTRPTPSNRNPDAANYYRKPVGFDGFNCPIYYLEIDLVQEGVTLNTVSGQESVVLLRPGFGDSYSGWTYTYLGKNSCTGAVGSNSDYYVSLGAPNPGVPITLQARGETHWHGTYRISTR
jgi:hypothetical protein